MIVFSFHAAEHQLFLQTGTLLLVMVQFCAELTHYLLTFLTEDLELKDLLVVEESTRSVIFTNHVVLINDLVEARLDSVELLFKTVYELFFRDGELFELLFLGVEITL